MRLVPWVLVAPVYPPVAIAREFPVDPIIVRAKWPSKTTADAVAYLELIGRELVPLVRGHRPAPSYPVL